MLQAFARRLGHESALRVLERPFVRYVGNNAREVRRHFHGLREALPSLHGVVLFDHVENEPQGIDPVECLVWKRREIENYVCSRAALEAFATASAREAEPENLFTSVECDRRLGAMREAIAEIQSALKTLGKGSPWSPDIKASDDFLDPLFRAYYPKKLNLPNLMPKRNFYQLVEHIPDSEIDSEIGAKLDAMASVAVAATATDSEVPSR